MALVLLCAALAASSPDPSAEPRAPSLEVWEQYARQGLVLAPTAGAGLASSFGRWVHATTPQRRQTQVRAQTTALSSAMLGLGLSMIVASAMTRDCASCIDAQALGYGLGAFTAGAGAALLLQSQTDRLGSHVTLSPRLNAVSGALSVVVRF